MVSGTEFQLAPLGEKKSAPRQGQGGGGGEVYDREKWNKPIEFVLSVIGFAVGLGNIWRFPYLCYKNGGGAFLIPYFVCLVAGGVPIFFLEVGIGQLTSQGGITVWDLCPIFKGIGYGTTIICFLLNIYYIVILAWAMHFFYYSFSAELPWSSCSNWWNTPKCFTVANRTSPGQQGRVDAVVEYWERKVLGLSSGIDDPGGLQWELALSLLVVWVLVYFCVWKGIKSSGKVVYFTEKTQMRAGLRTQEALALYEQREKANPHRTCVFSETPATFPYVMLTVLLIRGVTLEGAMDGIIFYLKPDFSKLFEAQVWIDAGTQIFFSYAIALGCMTAMGSYNSYHNNFVKDCIFISATNSLTSLYSGFAIFSVLGFMAQEQGVPIAEVAESGPGLVFIAYPKAVTQMPMAPLWSVLFFFMIILMGLDSQFVGVEGFITALVDLFPGVLRRGHRREMFIAVVSGVSFLIGLFMVTKGGMYLFQVFDYFAASGMVLLWFCFFESIAIAYGYGAERFYDDIKDMIGYRLSPWLKVCWLVFTPIVTMGILVFSVISAAPLTYNRSYHYPTWALVLGWTMALMSMVAIPIYFFFHLFSRPGGTLKEKWREAIKSKYDEVPK